MWSDHDRQIQTRQQAVPSGWATGHVRHITVLEDDKEPPRDGGQSQWRWHEISPRRVVGALFRGFGLIGVAFGVANYILGRWDPDLDPAFFAVSALLLLASVPVLWRVKPAPWP